MKTVPNPEADAEFQAAEQLFQQGKFAEAEAAFAKHRQERKGTPWGEKAQYLPGRVAVPARQARRRARQLRQLITDYPGTEYLDKLVSREYEIGQTGSRSRRPQGQAREEAPLVHAGSTAGSRCIDTHGYALGPSSTSATTTRRPARRRRRARIADEHMKHADYETAAIYYDQLITDHPKSPYLQRAQLAAIDARIKGYSAPSTTAAAWRRPAR